MYQIEKKDYGIWQMFGGFMTKDEMQSWYDEARKLLSTINGTFGAFIDMRTLKPLPTDAKEVMEAGQKMYREKGMIRSIVILNDVVTTMQFKRIAKQSGIDVGERYIDASKTANWETVGINWVKSGIDPDK